MSGKAFGGVAMPAAWEPTRISLLIGEDGLFKDGDWIESPFITDDGVRLIQTGNVGVGVYREQGFRYVSEETFHALRCTEVMPGDILICRLADPVGRACLVPNLGMKAITSVDNAILRTSNDHDRRFLVYMFSSKPYLDYLESECRGGTRNRVSRSFLGRLRVPLPALTTQKAIADFLDRETARVDQLIEKKKLARSLLAEKRRASIEVLVLGATAPQVEGGERWLSFMPGHWQALPLTHLVRFNGGATPSKDREEFWRGEIPWISPKDMKKEFLFDSEDHVSEQAVAESACRLIEPDAVLIVTRGMILARTVPVARLGVRATINQDMKAMVPRAGILSEYLLRLLQGLEGVLLSFVEDSAHGTKKLRTERLFKTPFPIPPLAEQAELARRISALNESIEATIFAIDRSVDALLEFRPSLITAAVTGQIDVATWGRRGSTDRRLEAIEMELGAVAGP